MSKILYAASTYSHLKSFHLEYIAALKAMGHEVLTMANGTEADFNIPFEKKILSKKNTACQRKIARIVAEEGFDAILVNTTLAAFHIRLALKNKKRPRIVNFVHGYLFSKKSPIIKRSVFLLCEKILRSKTDALIVMNGEDFDIAERNRLSAGRLYMTRGMGVNALLPTKPREQARKELGFEDKYVITFVGELSGRKNQEFLIRALKKVREAIPNAYLSLVGDGDKEDSLRALCGELLLSDAVGFLGKRYDVADIINASDLYVSAAKSEGLPFNILEALSLGADVIASDVKGHSDILKNKDAGALYTPGNLQELVDYIIKYHNGELSTASDKAEAAFKPFSHGEVFEETLSIMAEALML